MKIYEELGVPKDPRKEEIQQSLRTLSKMLHPDLHEAALKSSDTPAEEVASQGWLWLVCIVLIFGIGYCLWRMAPEPAVLAQSLAQSPGLDDQGPLLMSSPNRVDPVGNLRQESKPLQQHLEGVWLYAMNTSTKPAKWAHAVANVELKIEEHNGEIVGAYESSYQIPDQASPQELSFRFRGPSGRNEFGWALGEVKGRIQLRPESDEVMKVSWRIENDRNLGGLEAGSVTLVRKKNSPAVRR